MSATFRPTTGKNMKAYINAGTHAVPVWYLIQEIGDLNISDFSRNQATLKRRARDFAKNLIGMIEVIGIEFTLHFGLGVQVYNYMRNSFLQGTVFEYAFMNGLITVNGNQGLTIQANIENFPWNQALEEVSGHDVRLCTGYAEDEVNGGELDPYWFIVGTTTTTTTTT